MASDTDITITQGITLRRIFAWTQPDADDGTPGAAIPLEGYTPVMQFRKRAGGALIDDWTPYLVIEPEGEAGPLVGELHLRIGADVTEGYTKGGVYELRLVDSGDSTEVVELINGRVLIKKEIVDTDGS